MDIGAREIIAKHRDMQRVGKMAGGSKHRVKGLYSAVFQFQVPPWRLSRWIEDRMNVSDRRVEADQRHDIEMAGVILQILVHVPVVGKGLNIRVEIQIMEPRHTARRVDVQGTIG